MPEHLAVALGAAAQGHTTRAKGTSPGTPRLAPRLGSLPLVLWRRFSAPSSQTTPPAHRMWVMHGPLVPRSKTDSFTLRKRTLSGCADKAKKRFTDDEDLGIVFCADARWSSQVARKAHNLEVAGSNPARATNRIHSRTRPRTVGGICQRAPGFKDAWGSRADPAHPPKSPSAGRCAEL